MEVSLMFSSKSDNWATPQRLFDELNREFAFTLDPCASVENAKCDFFYTKEDNGLLQNWGGHNVFCNPPYGKEIGKWVAKCAEESNKFNTCCVMLIPARTDTKWFHQYIWGKAEVRFLKGRLKFGNAKNAAPFPSMIVIFKNN